MSLWQLARNCPFHGLFWVSVSGGCLAGQSGTEASDKAKATQVRVPSSRALSCLHDSYAKHKLQGCEPVVCVRSAAYNFAVFSQETDKSSGQPAEESDAPYKTTQEEPNTEPETKKKAPAARKAAAAKDTGGAKAATGKKGADASQGKAKADKPTPVKRERKVFELPGQRRDTPDEVAMLALVGGMPHNPAWRCHSV